MDDITTAVAKLQAQQSSMSADLHDMKTSMHSIAESLKNLSVVEQRQLALSETAARAHSRLDTVESTLKEEAKGHEKRLQAIEIAMVQRNRARHTNSTIPSSRQVAKNTHSGSPDSGNYQSSMRNTFLSPDGFDTGSV